MLGTVCGSLNFTHFFHICVCIFFFVGFPHDVKHIKIRMECLFFGVFFNKKTGRAQVILKNGRLYRNTQPPKSTKQRFAPIFQRHLPFPNPSFIPQHDKSRNTLHVLSASRPPHGSSVRAPPQRAAAAGSPRPPRRGCLPPLGGPGRAPQ